MSRINVENIRHPDAASDSISLNSSARVGVGTSSPQRLLHLNGGAETVKLQITNTSTGSGTDGEGFQIGIATDGTANIEQRENQDLVFHTNNTERLRILADGTIRLNNTSGIDFSQIQTNATGMTSETLDSYEEGTFTPSFTSGTSGSGYTRQVGEYTKIGRLVTFTLTIDGDGGLTGTATAIEIGGLPFTSRNVAEIGGAQVTYPGDFDTTNDRRFWLVAQNNTTLSYRSATAAQINGNLVNNINSQLNLCGYYFTDA